MTPPQPDDALTAVTRRPPHTRTNKTLAVLLGLAAAVCPAVSGYFAYRQAKVENGVETRKVHETADVGYQTIVQMMTLMQGAMREQDARIVWLEGVCKEQKERMSLPDAPSTPPPTPVLVPLQRSRLFRALPQTLDMAAEAR